MPFDPLLHVQDGAQTSTDEWDVVLDFDASSAGVKRWRLSDGDKLGGGLELFVLEWDQATSTIDVLPGGGSAIGNLGTVAAPWTNINVTATTINTVAYAWPGANAAGQLENDGAGNLTWAAGSAITGSGAANRVAFWTAASVLSSSANFLFDGTDVTMLSSLKIGGSGTASESLEVVGTIDVTNGDIIMSNARSIGWVSSTEKIAASQSTGILEIDAGTEIVLDSPLVRVTTSLGVGVAASGTAGQIDATDLVLSGNAKFTDGESSAPTNDLEAYIYRTNTSGGSFPFDAFGNLVLQPRSSDAQSKDIVFMTGTGSTTTVPRMSIAGVTGRVTINSHLNVGTAAIAAPYANADGELGCLALNVGGGSAANRGEMFLSNGTASLFYSPSANTLLAAGGNFIYGTSTANDMIFRTGGTSRLRITSAGNMTWQTDNTLDVGASGANRPRTIYLGTRVSTPLLQPEGSTALVIARQDGTAWATLSSSFDLVNINSVTLWNDNVSLRFGNATDVEIDWGTTQTNDGLMWGIGVGTAAQSGNIVITEASQVNVDHLYATSADPRLYVVSASAVGDFISFHHDGTNAQIICGAGGLQVTDSLGVGLAPTGNAGDLLVGSSIAFLEYDESGQFMRLSGDGSIGGGPAVEYFRDESPGVAGETTVMRFAGRSTTSVKRFFGTISCEAAVATNASEEGELRFATIVAGTTTEKLRISDVVDFRRALTPANTNVPTHINTPTGVAAAQTGWLQIKVNGAVGYVPIWQ